MFRVALVITLLLVQAPQSTGVVQGTVVRVGTAEGLPGVDVALMPASVTPDAAPPVRIGTTDALGHFEIRNVPAGRYSISIQSNGYSGAPTNLRMASVAANTTLDLNLSAIPGAIIRGRVLSSNGEFASNANVQALRLFYEGGSPRLQSITSKSTDDRGEYRLFGVPPGEYIIGVNPKAPLANSTPGTGTVRDVKTYFPSTDNPADAIQLTINGGEEISGIDIGMRSAVHVRVTGRVLSQAAPPAPIRNDPGLPGVFEAIANAQINNVQLQLVPRGADRPIELGGPSNVALLGAEFEVRDVVPGAYDLYATGLSRDGPAMGRVPIVVANNDVTGITIVLHNGVDVDGAITIDGVAPTRPVNVIMQAMDVQWRAGTGGGFPIRSVPEGRYRVLPLVEPQYYVEDILQNGRSIYDSGLEVGSTPPDPVEVVVKSGAGSVDGTVLDAANNFVAGGTIALVPLTRRGNTALYKSTSADPAGRFSIRGIAPGEYLLFAWPAQINGAFFNAAFLRKYEESGVPVTVTKDGASTIRLPLSRIR